MVETVLSVAVEVGKWLAAPIGRQFMYLYNYKSNFDDLENEVEKLKEAKEVIQRKIVVAEENVEEIDSGVKKWQKNVDSIIVQATNLIAEKENDRCFKGFCPNLITRYRHGKKAFKIKEDNISPLLQQQKDFDKVSKPILDLEDVRLKPDRNYTVMESRKSILIDLVNALNDPNVNMIGIYGMGGIGKTTIVKEVAGQVKKFFDKVVFVEVTKTPDVKKIQTEIADQLRLQFENETEKINKLYERLRKKEEKDGEKNEGKILIILDNLWDANFDLKSIGIPAQSDDRGCKLLLTARHQHVLKNMGDPKLLQIGNLSEEESWRLFKNMAGDFIETHEFKSLAENICSICKGLPIAIVTIARALRHKNQPSLWKEALRKLKRSSPNNFTEEMREAFVTIELSYKYLEGEELQKTFLLCSLMRHPGFILDLVKYFVGLDIFQDIYSIEEARNKVYKLIDDLKDSCLLFNGHTSESFSMHDFVREVALSIAIRDDHVFSVRNENTLQWPHQNRLKFCKKIFIRDSTISELCSGLDCPELESFFINTKIGDSHVEIPENFFTKMTKLKVLDLTRVQFFSLQSSLQFLVNLQTLCLDYCKLEDVAIIGMLNKLKILSLRGSNVEHLPKEIGRLTELSLLDLSDCQALNLIAPNVLSSLVNLEELYMNGCSVLWEVEASNVERSNASLGELKYLSHLTTLELDIKEENIFPKGLFTTKKLERYKISIGEGSSKFGRSYILGDNMRHMSIKSFSYDEPWTSTRMLKLKLTSIIWSEELQGFRNVEFLCIDKLKQGIKHVLYELDKEGFSKLKHLHVHNNPNILCLVDSIKCVPHDAFPAFPLLESLILFNLIELHKICYGQPIVGSFSKLKIIEVGSCTKLENIFSFSSPSSLPQLQRINVSDCKNMKEIFVVEREDDVNINEVICQLRFLTLMKLPRIANFCLEVKTPPTSQSSQESTTDLQYNDINLEHELDTPSPLFNEKVIFPNLEALELQAINCQMIWDSQLPTMSDCYRNLTRLIIKDIGRLKYVFPSSMVTNFKQFQHLKISNCVELKEIIAKERGAETPPKFIFPRVEFLELENLPELTTFYPGIHTSEWPKLKKLQVSSCDKLQMSTSECKIILSPNLEALDLHGTTHFGRIRDHLIQNTSSSYQSLTHLIVAKCAKLKYIFSSSVIKSFEWLQHLEISSCKELKEIVTKEGAEEIATFTFPRVTFLKLNNLPELTCLCLGQHTSEWPMLKELKVYKCEKLQLLTSDYKVVFPNLGALELKETNSQMIWDSQLPAMSDCYGNLTFLIIKDIGRLKYVFPSSMVKNFKQLQYITIRSCKELKEIVAKEGEEAPLTFIFPRVGFLTLENLPELTTFYPGIHTSEWPKLKELEVSSCDKLQILTSDYKVVFPNLKALELDETNSQMIWDSQLPAMSDCYGNLTRLIIKNIGRLKYVFPSSMVKNFKQLQYIEIGSCKELKEIVAKEGVEATATFIFPRVEFLKLENLPELTTFYPRIHTSEWPKLKELEVSSCEKLQMSTSECKIVYSNLEALDLHGTHFEMIWDHLIQNTSSSYQNLTRLIMTKCAKLKYIFPSSMIKSFEQLQHLEISSCKELKEIVTKEEAKEIATLTFPHVAYLKLNDLPELIGLCLGLHTSEWPTLKELEVYKCEKLQLTSDFKFNADWEKLLLRRDNMMTWHCLFPEHFFFKGTIEIKGDKSTNVLLDILQRSIHLEKLILSDSLYKEIFSCGEKDKYTGTLMQIKCLKLNDLSKLECMWKQDSKLEFVLQNLGVLEVTDCDRLISLLPSHASFANLTVLRVDRCWGMANLFVPSTAKSLVQLMEMKIENCKIITEIISTEDDEDLRVEDEIVFSKLKLLSLEDLENLICFCFGNYNFEFPVLEELIVKECPNMKTFSEAVVSAPSLGKVKFEQDDNEEECWKGDLNTTIQHQHKKVVNSNLEELTLSGKDIMPVWQDPLPEHQFCKVKVLKVIRDESTHIPIEIFQRFKNLEKLMLKVSSYQEMFSCGEDEKHAGMLTRIKKLQLLGLFNLKNMWKQDSHLDSILQNLEMLQVCCCHNLINLLPSSASFENLTTLDVWHCDGLKNLISSSTAKSLVRLEEMSISQCEVMIEVVSNEGDEENDEIVFEKLKSLKLGDLESLTSFYCGNYTFKFPSLEKLSVIECPKMKTFSEGFLSTPNLQKVMQDWDDKEEYWEGDLNTTIQHRHKNLNIQISEKDSGQTSMKSPE